ncbi:hypothetical protein C8J57DRAFT_1242832 [Mycena rebaudengoi]|nr:hypothetical protein C8J57DRAFT_1242832 [Mycena rebaudengoi]
MTRSIDVHQNLRCATVAYRASVSRRNRASGYHDCQHVAVLFCSACQKLEATLVAFNLSALNDPIWGAPVTWLQAIRGVYPQFPSHILHSKESWVAQFLSPHFVQYGGTRISPQIPNTPRRGRSETAYKFNTCASGPPISSKSPYSFMYHLQEENFRIMEREDTDWAYRGERVPGPEDSDSDDDTMPALINPVRVCRGVAWHAAVVDRGRNSSPEGYTERDSSPEGDVNQRDASLESDSLFSSSPASSPPPLEAVLGNSTMDCDTEPEDDRSSMDCDERTERLSPTVSDFETPSRKLITYLARDKARLRRQRERDDATHDLEFLAIMQATTPRRSRRLRTGRVDDSTEGDVWSTADLSALELEIFTGTIEAPQAMIDLQEYVTGVIAGGPKGQTAWWTGIVSTAFQDMRRVYRNGDFTQFGEGESLVRAGIDYGVNGPFIINNLRVNRPTAFKRSLLIKTPSELFRQFAPKLFAHTMSKLDQLKEGNLHPPFKHSVFTTAEWSFGDAASPPCIGGEFQSGDLGKSLKNSVQVEGHTKVSRWTEEAGMMPSAN